MDRRIVTEQEILAKQTPAGGWTREALSEWGVPWPPPKGWKQRLVEAGAPYDQGDNQPSILANRSE